MMGGIWIRILKSRDRIRNKSFRIHKTVLVTCWWGTPVRKWWVGSGSGSLKSRGRIRNKSFRIDLLMGNSCEKMMGGREMRLLSPQMVKMVSRTRSLEVFRASGRMMACTNTSCIFEDGFEDARTPAEFSNMFMMMHAHQPNVRIWFRW